jgi:protein phosphatase 2C family protein 2/3
MEDAHTISLDLDEPRSDATSNTFFAVYDGHGGIAPTFSTLVCLGLSNLSAGGSVARFAGQNVHRRLVKEDSYQRQNYEEAMRRAFLGTDEDMLSGM